MSQIEFGEFKLFEKLSDTKIEYSLPEDGHVLILESSLNVTFGVRETSQMLLIEISRNANALNLVVKSQISRRSFINTEKEWLNA